MLCYPIFIFFQLDKKGEILTDAPLYRPALSMKESQKLLDSLDTMSDDEVAAVLSKLQAAVKDRIQSKSHHLSFHPPSMFFSA